MLDPTIPEVRRLLIAERQAALRADFRSVTAGPGPLRRRLGQVLVAIGLRLAQQPMSGVGAKVEEAPADAGASSRRWSILATSR